MWDGFVAALAGQIHADFCNFARISLYSEFSHF
jgi:hypothetical protein